MKPNQAKRFKDFYYFILEADIQAAFSTLSIHIVPKTLAFCRVHPVVAAAILFEPHSMHGTVELFNYQTLSTFRSRSLREDGTDGP